MDGRINRWKDRQIYTHVCVLDWMRLVCTLVEIGINHSAVLSPSVQVDI